MTTRTRRQLMTCILLALLVVAIGLTGCAPTAEPQGFWGKVWSLEVGPDYRAPELRPPETFRSQVGPSEAASLADLPWWRVFDDESLKRLIATALVHSYNLQAAVARVDEARAWVWVAASPLYPHIGYEGQASREKVFFPARLENAENPTFNSFAGLFNVVWELDVWGRIRRSTEAARANLFAQEYVRRGVILTLVSDVAAGYFRLLELDRELAIAEESSRTYKKTLELFTQRFEAGKDSRLPVVRAQAAYDSSIATIASLKRAIAQEENVLSVLSGAYPEEIERKTPLSGHAAPPVPVGLTSALMQRRPDLLEAEQTMMRANAQVGVAMADFFPRIGLSALYGGQTQNIDQILNSDFSIWSIFGGIAGPIFQGGQLLGTYYAQQAFWDDSVAQYKQKVLVAFQEVSDTLIAQKTLAAQRAAQESQVAALKEAVSLALLRYDVGRASYFEVLEAEMLLFPAEDALAQTERDQFLAVIDLYKALGGGWRLGDAEWIPSTQR